MGSSSDSEGVLTYVDPRGRFVRAGSVVVDPGRIAVVSYGKERPVALGSDEASWAQNRRAASVIIN